MNTKNYKSRSLFWAQAILAIFAVFMACAIVTVGAAQGHGVESTIVAAVLLTLVSCALNKPQARLCAVTLSVPEILADVMDAFKYECPEVFGPNGFATDMSSETAALGDKITAKISKVPVTGAYDRANGGFKNATQDVTTLMEDVPVTLDQFRIVTVNVNYLTTLVSKLELYEAAIKNQGYALSKYVLDTILSKLIADNFSNSIPIPVANVSLDTLDLNIRDQMNTQKMSDMGRFMICNTPFASKLGGDDRVRNSQFGIDQKNGGRGYRRFTDIGGMGWIREYPDFPANGINLQAFAAEKRGVVVASRAMKFENVAAKLGIPEVMSFDQLADELSGVHMTGTGWQEAGTADVYVACGVLFGVGVGKQGGAAGTITDNGGLLIRNAAV